MARILGLVPVLALLLAPIPAGATFHLSVINELMSGITGDPSVQFVEIEMDADLQTSVGNTRLTAFNCDGSSHTVLLTIPAGTVLPKGGAGQTWLMASESFAAAAGIAPDFTWHKGTIPPNCGMVCWGAPGIVPPNPASWNAGDPNQYVDCVGYGGYTGPTKTSEHDGTQTSGTPSDEPAGDGVQSLTRDVETGDNDTDFSLDCPTPTNDAGQTGTFGTCGAGTTTTTRS